MKLTDLCHYSRNIGIAACLALGALALPTSASAVLIDFETASSPVTTNGVFHTEDGFEFDFQGALDVYANSASQGFTSRYIDFHDHDFNNTNDGSYVEMRLVGGGLFDISSADIFGEGLSGSAQVYSSAGDLLSVSNTGAQNFTLNWSNVSWVRFESYFDVSFDNIVADAAGVPEPGVVGMAGLGLLGLVATRRRRKA